MNYAQRNATILSRLDRHAKHPAAAELKKAALNCFAIAQKFSDQRDELLQDGRYSAAGKQAQLAELRATQERLMADARAPIDSAMKGIDRLRGQIKPAPVDRTDAVAEMRRAEIRTYMRGLTDLARKGKLLSPQPDPSILDSVLDMPCELSGVTAEDYALAREAREEQLHGPKLREIEALQAVVGEADAAASIARADLASMDNR
jgi:hypothetical protein